MNASPKKFERVAQSSLDWLGTGPIPAKPYYDPDFYEIERKAVFLRNWIVAGHVCELPEAGNFIRREFEFAGASLLIVRGKDGAIRAFQNVCTHRGTQLVDEAQGKRATFSCPYHMWTFGTDGALLSAPDFEAFGLEREDCALKQVALDVCAGLIFVNFAKEPTPLRLWLNGLDEKLETMPVAKAVSFSEYTYDIDANWKLTYDNFQENYHLRFIHTRSGASAFAPENPFGYPLSFGFHGVHRTQTIWSNPHAKPTPTQAIAYGRAGALAVQDDILGTPTGREYLALFPCFFILGSPLQNFSHVVYPISATKSRGVIRLYWVSEDRSASERFAREHITQVAREVHAEDCAVIEAGQRGLSSGALDHIHFQTQEALCRHLFNGVNEAVEAYQKELSQ
jgi:phenylpropionate dioxygenase-like ring-hydroxylating dioxygenase large terminal subunit